MSAERKPSVYRDATDCWRLIEADALLTLAKLPENSIDAIVVDPPYGIGFHDEAWDGADIYRAASRDGEQLSAGEAFTRWTRTWAAECRRVLKPGGHMLAFGSPKTFHRLTSGVEDAGLQIRDVLLWVHAQGAPKARKLAGGLAPLLKPAYEPILCARKPLVGTTPRNLEEWGTGALNIEASRVGGYWPAHLALSHAPGCSETRCMSDCPAGLLDAAHPELRPSRLFFCAKASKREREAGCDELPLQSDLLYSRPAVRLRRNIHPTVKPLALMRWLVGLITPPGGVVLDPFAGSGTTGIAAIAEDRVFLGIEREARYIDIGCARLAHWAQESVKGSA
ncbi:MAG: site-specific DNA-methyltransferase [Solirubrobacteraceae bacterium]